MLRTDVSAKVLGRGLSPEEDVFCSVVFVDVSTAVIESVDVDDDAFIVNVAMNGLNNGF